MLVRFQEKSDTQVYVNVRKVAAITMVVGADGKPDPDKCSIHTEQGLIAVSESPADVAVKINAAMEASPTGRVAAVMERRLDGPALPEKPFTPDFGQRGPAPCQSIAMYLLTYLKVRVPIEVIARWSPDEVREAMQFASLRSNPALDLVIQRPPEVLEEYLTLKVHTPDVRTWLALCDYTVSAQTIDTWTDAQREQVIRYLETLERLTSGDSNLGEGVAVPEEPEFLKPFSVNAKPAEEAAVAP